MKNVNKQKITVLIFLLIITLSGVAQKYYEIESNNIRIDPEWVKTYQSRKMIWAFDSEADHEGNIYSTGYFHKQLTIDSIALTPSTKCSYRCPDTYFLMKHNSEGKLLWVRYAEGNSRPSKIIITPNKEVMVFGNLYSEELVFINPGSDSIVIHKKEKQNSAAFVAKYNSDGKLIHAHSFDNENLISINDATIDNKGNIYIGGTYYFSVGSLRKNSFLVFKTDSDYKEIWKYKGDTIGDSRVNSITLDRKNNLWVTGGYSDHIKIDNHDFIEYKERGLSSFAGFLMQINKNGEVKLATNQQNDKPLNSGVHIVSNNKNKLYLVTQQSQSRSTLTYLNSKNKVIWENNIQGRSTNGITKLIVDSRGDLYFSGEGYGAVFGSTDVNLYSFKAKGNFDLFLGKYNKKGNLLWLKTAGGEQLEYLKSMALFNNDVYAFGWFHSNLPFNDSTVTNNSGYAFYQAKFSGEKLKAINSDPVPYIDDAPEVEYPTNPNTCTCKTEPAKYKRNIALVKRLIDDQINIESLNLGALGNLELLESVFFQNLQVSSSSGVSNYFFDAVAFNPITISEPNNSYGINISPCTNKKQAYSIPVSFTYNNQIKRYSREFEIEEFDYSTRAYYGVLLAITNKSNEDLLFQSLFRDDYINIHDFTNSINKKYGTSFKMGNKNIAYDEIRESIGGDAMDPEGFVQTLIDQLEATNENFDMESFIFNEFVSKDKTPHKITKNEEKKLANIFDMRYSFDEINKMIHPQIDFSLEVEKLEIILNDQILRKWNSVLNQPLINDKKTVPASILASTKEVNFSSEKGLSTKLNDICFYRSEITNTGILIDFEEANIINVTPQNVRLIVLDYPLFIADSGMVESWRSSIKVMKYDYDSVLMNFKGVNVNKSKIKIPFNQTYINAIGRNIIVNNSLITGVILIKIEGKLTNPEGQFIIYTAEGQEIKTTINQLKSELKKNGLKDFMIKKSPKEISIFFKKQI